LAASDERLPTGPQEPSVAQAGGSVGEPPLVIDARELFQGRKEIWIRHGEVRYCLRLTRRNKLILQK
jgi:hemin uptake protein HemP